MKRLLITLLPVLAVIVGVGMALAQNEEPTVYVIKKGDTLWGISDRFVKDPYYWPNLWAANDPDITNPHLIFPGQNVRIFSDRILLEPPPAKEAGSVKVGAPEQMTPAQLEVTSPAAKSFVVGGGAGFLLEDGIKPSGYVISTQQSRQMMGEDDITYTDIGKSKGAKVGDRFSIFQKKGPVSHPVTNVIMGNKVIPLGTLQLTEMEEKSSKAIITKSFLEIGPGAYLMPYREKKREVTLKASDRELSGYIIDSQKGTLAISAGDIVFIDIGASKGLEVGNMLYIGREILPDNRNIMGSSLKLPTEVLGVLVVVDTGEKVATALIIKSIDTIYIGDRVELKKSK